MVDIKIPLYQPSLKGHERRYVSDCLESTWVSSIGEYIPRFEKAFAKFHDFKDATTVCNGTTALHVALLCLDIKTGDEVIVPTFTYIASVNAMSYVGAIPVFVDSLPDTWQMDPVQIEKKITKKTKAIMVVHLYGHPCEMSLIVSIAKKHNLKIIEDCAEAIASKYRGSFVGTFGDIATFSFFGNKTITTGEGGMVATNNINLIEKANHFKGQGLTPGREYWHDVVGYNYRMTNVCAAIGLAQLERIEVIVKRKLQIAKWYESDLLNLPVSLHQAKGNVLHSYWMVSILVPEAKYRDELRSYLRQNGVDTRPLFPPAHSMPMYKDKGLYPVADDLSSRGMNLPSWPDLTRHQVGLVTNLIKQFFKSINYV